MVPSISSSRYSGAIQDVDSGIFDVRLLPYLLRTEAFIPFHCSNGKKGSRKRKRGAKKEDAVILIKTEL